MACESERKTPCWRDRVATSGLIAADGRTDRKAMWCEIAGQTTLRGGKKERKGRPAVWAVVGDRQCEEKGEGVECAYNDQ